MPVLREVKQRAASHRCRKADTVGRGLVEDELWCLLSGFGRQPATGLQKQVRGHSHAATEGSFPVRDAVNGQQPATELQCGHRLG